MVLQAEEKHVADSMEVNLPLWEHKCAEAEARHVTRAADNAAAIERLQTDLAEQFRQLDG